MSSMEGDSLIQSYPWLLSNLFYTFSQNTGYTNSINYVKDKEVCAYCCGWLVVKDQRKIHYLINAKSLEKIRLPPTNFNYTNCVLTRSPTDFDCHVLFMAKDAIRCCQPGDRKYKTYRLEESMHFDEKLVAVLEGKVYYVMAFSLANLVMIECNRSTLQFTKMDMPPFSFNVVVSPSIGSYLVESGSELFLVFKSYCVLHPKEFTKEPDFFLVFRFDFVNKLWVQVDDIGKCTIFLGGGSVSFCATEPRIKPNSIYFLQDEYVHVYDLKNHSFSLLPNELKMVTLHIQEELNENLDYEKQNIKFLPQMCFDASKLVLARMFTLDPGALGVIHSTCKNWGSIDRPPVSDIDLRYNKYPYLVTLINDRCKFFHPAYDHTFCLDTPELLGSYICSARFGWLLLGRENKETQEHEYFFFNPLTKQKISLPGPNQDVRLTMSFSSPPTSLDCFVVAVAVYGCIIGICKCGEDRWTFWRLSASIRVVNYQPVFHKQKCYCVGFNKKLIVVDLNTRKLFQIGKTLSTDLADFDECFLVEDGKALLGVFLLSGKRTPQLMRMDLLQNKEGMATITEFKQQNDLC